MTILREDEHRALRGIELSGKILDLGGDARSSYRKLFRGSFTLTSLNLAPETRPDIIADLEKPLPVADGSFDGALLMNVLEHVFEYRQLINECRRVLVPGGKIVIAVPYLFPYHPSPGDFHRYSAEALRRMLEGFADVRIEPLGSGVFSARFLFLERLLPGGLQDAFAWLLHPLVRALDRLFAMVARGFGKQYRPSDYALGFIVTASKP